MSLHDQLTLPDSSCEWVHLRLGPIAYRWAGAFVASGRRESIPVTWEDFVLFELEVLRPIRRGLASVRREAADLRRASEQGDRDGFERAECRLPSAIRELLEPERQLQLVAPDLAEEVHACRVATFAKTGDALGDAAERLVGTWLSVVEHLVALAASYREALEDEDALAAHIAERDPAPSSAPVPDPRAPRAPKEPGPSSKRQRIVLRVLRDARGSFVPEATIAHALEEAGMEGSGVREGVRRLRNDFAWPIETAAKDSADQGWRLPV